MSGCDFVCDDTYERCDQMCCPTTCPPGQVLYDGTCAQAHLQTADAEGNIGEHTSLALAAVRAAGYTDANITDITVVIAQKTLSNLFNHVHDTVLDFPAPPPLDD